MAKAKRPSRNKNQLGFTLKQIAPKTTTQEEVFRAFNESLSTQLLLHGYAGTGKTFLALNHGLKEVLDRNTYGKIVIVRSCVPTRDIGFMPGTQQEKEGVYEAPYRDIVNELFGRGDAYDIMRQKGLIEFISTSFVRGLTMRNSFVVIDEIQNMSFQELDTVMTRLGDDCRSVWVGDYRQTDLKNKEREGLQSFLKILNNMSSIERIEFLQQDIVRSPLVKQYIIERTELGL